MAIKVSGTTVIDNDRNISNVGIITATSFSGDGSNLTNVPKQGGTFSGIASGTLPNGSVVVLNADGTVSTASTFSGKTFATSDSKIMDSYLRTLYTDIAYDSTNGKVICVYEGSRWNPSENKRAYAVVGEVFEDSISFGTPIQYSDVRPGWTQVIYDSSTDRVVLFHANSGGGHGFSANSGAYVVGTISGNTIILGSTYVQNPNTDLAVPGYGVRTILGNGAPGTFIAQIPRTSAFSNSMGVVGTITGGTTNTISFGTTALLSFCQLNVSNGVKNDIVHFNDGTDKTVFAFSDNTNSSRGTAVIASQSGTSLTYGTPVVFRIGSTIRIACTYDTNENRVVITTGASGNGGIGNAYVGQVSGNSITFGSPVVIDTTTSGLFMGGHAIAFDSSNNKVIIGYTIGGNWPYPGYLYVGTVDGSTNSITITSPQTYKNFPLEEDVTQTQMVYDSINDKIIIIHENAVRSRTEGFLLKADLDNSNLTDGNFIGFSDGSYTNGQTASIKIISNIDDSQSGLTTGSKYYVRRDGTLSTVSDLPIVLAGTALSSDKIIVKQ